MKSWLATKPLERGLYASPVVLDGPDSRAVLALSPAEIAQILEGISVHRATYASHYLRTEKIRCKIDISGDFSALMFAVYVSRLILSTHDGDTDC